jgi:hypothetical protein
MLSSAARTCPAPISEEKPKKKRGGYYLCLKLHPKEIVILSSGKEKKGDRVSERGGGEGEGEGGGEGGREGGRDLEVACAIYIEGAL